MEKVSFLAPLPKLFKQISVQSLAVLLSITYKAGEEKSRCHLFLICAFFALWWKKTYCTEEFYYFGLVHYSAVLVGNNLC